MTGHQIRPLNPSLICLRSLLGDELMRNLKKLQLTLPQRRTDRYGRESENSGVWLSGAVFVKDVFLLFRGEGICFCRFIFL